MKSKIANFSAGPAAIPQEVLQEVKNELLNYKNIGSSIPLIALQKHEVKINLNIRNLDELIIELDNTNLFLKETKKQLKLAEEDLQRKKKK